MFGIIGKGVVGSSLGTSIERLLNEKPLYWDLVTDYTFEEFANKCDVIFICTPSLQIGSNESIDNNLTLEYAHKIAMISDDITIVQKSTCLPGTADYITSLIKNPYLVMPEFLHANTALYDTLNPERIVIGHDRTIAIHEDIVNYIKEIKRNTELKTSIPIHVFTYYEAECVKIIANTLLATLISFWNDMYLNFGINDRVSKVICEDKYLKSCFREFGKAYDGACLPKDTISLQKYLNDNNKYSKFLDATIFINNKMKRDYGIQKTLLTDLNI